MGGLCNWNSASQLNSLGAALTTSINALEIILQEKEKTDT